MCKQQSCDAISTELNSHINKQIDITGPYKCNELINVFKKPSVNIVSAISLDRY